MAQRSQADQPDARDLIEAQVRESYGRVVYSHKTHEKCADILLERLSKIKVAQIVLSAITTGGFIAAFLGAGPVGAGIGVAVSTVLLALNTYTKDYDLGEIAQKHRHAAADLWLIRERYVSLITDLQVGKDSIEKMATRREALTDDLHEAYAGAPSTNYKAYKKAQEGLQQLEEMSFTEPELDALLPKALRKGEGARRPEEAGGE